MPGPVRPWESGGRWARGVSGARAGCRGRRQPRGAQLLGGVGPGARASRPEEALRLPGSRAGSGARRDSCAERDARPRPPMGERVRRPYAAPLFAPGAPAAREGAASCGHGGRALPLGYRVWGCREVPV